MEKFNRELNGYKRSEVNEFLIEVIEQTEKVLAKVENQKREIQFLNEKIIHYQNIENSLRMALDRAENMGSHIRREAQSEAKQIVAEARRNADFIVNDALIRTEKLELKNRNIERNIRVLKNKLRTIIEQQLEVVEEIAENSTEATESSDNA